VPKQHEVPSERQPGSLTFPRRNHLILKELRQTREWKRNGNFDLKSQLVLFLGNSGFLVGEARPCGIRKEPEPLSLPSKLAER
jgi:hypothetical protein